jgi:hypothetical protein
MYMYQCSLFYSDRFDSFFFFSVLLYSFFSVPQVREAELDRAIVETGDGLDDVAAVAMFGEEREAWEKEQSQQQALALKKQKQYQKALAKIQSGDYQIQVRWLKV